MATFSGHQNPYTKATTPLLTRSKPTATTTADDDRNDDLKAIHTILNLLCINLDQAHTTITSTLTSYLTFFFLTIAIPTLSHFTFSYNTPREPYNLVVQLSLTLIATLSFTTITITTRRSNGLRRLLFLDKHHLRTKHLYSLELRRSLKLLTYFILPCFALEVTYKIWWYIVGAGKIPYIYSPAISYTICCVLELASWVYRTGNFFLVCLMFRVICHLMILRLRDFAAVFQESAEVSKVLGEHLRVRRQLKVISHRFRMFILLGFVLVTVSQLACMLITLRPSSDDDLFNTGEIPLSSIVLVSGLIICFRNAAKITHKAQSLTSHAAKWHVCATIDSFTVDAENGVPSTVVHGSNDSEDDNEKDSDEDELEGTDIVYSQVHTINFQERQALVTYLENNRPAITMFGFTLDRTLLQAIFSLEMMMLLWVLNKTIGIS